MDVLNFAVQLKLLRLLALGDAQLLAHIELFDFLGPEVHLDRGAWHSICQRTRKHTEQNLFKARLVALEPQIFEIFLASSATAILRIILDLYLDLLLGALVSD